MYQKTLIWSLLNTMGTHWKQGSSSLQMFGLHFQSSELLKALSADCSLFLSPTSLEYTSGLKMSDLSATF